MKTAKFIAGSVITGALITLVTGAISNTSFQSVGASWYGYPLKWLIKRVLAPQYNPWKILYLNFGFDLVFWIVVVAVIMFIAKSSKKKEKGNRKG